jgi:ubiquinone/menaquinone biosynthesis C-methylase UbiE
MLLGGGFLTGVVVTLGALIYQHRSRIRIPSVESLEDPDVARAFGDISTKPPWKLLRWYLSRRALELKDHGEAVDIGCGPGFLVIALAKHSRRLHVTGVDSSKEMLIQAERNACTSGVSESVSFKIGNAEKIPFDAGSLDLVISTLSLHHWKKPIDVMNEIARVLKPGGGYLIFDLRRDMAAPLYVFLWFITHFIVPVPLRSAHEPLSSRDAAYTIHEAINLVEKSNLINYIVNENPGWVLIEGKMPSGDVRD